MDLGDAWRVHPTVTREIQVGSNPIRSANSLLVQWLGYLTVYQMVRVRFPHKLLMTL